MMMICSLVCARFFFLGLALRIILGFAMRVVGTTLELPILLLRCIPSRCVFPITALRVA